MVESPVEVVSENLQARKRNHISHVWAVNAAAACPRLTRTKLLLRLIRHKRDLKLVAMAVMRDAVVSQIRLRIDVLEGFDRHGERRCLCAAHLRCKTGASDDEQTQEKQCLHRERELTINENKISDGWRGGASLRVEGGISWK